ncbi:MAG: hypothetical protein K0U24_06835 [Gammaproteobacteria bacterium]|nr:hypothetical protein [Gammaproteobacteria bacterium]MCH9763918.1 hypothetical protein [Gammaproteobacteria bacterium]
MKAEKIARFFNFLREKLRSATKNPTTDIPQIESYFVFSDPDKAYLRELNAHCQQLSGGKNTPETAVPFLFYQLTQKLLREGQAQVSIFLLLSYIRNTFTMRWENRLRHLSPNDLLYASLESRPWAITARALQTLVSEAYELDLMTMSDLRRVAPTYNMGREHCMDYCELFFPGLNELLSRGRENFDSGKGCFCLPPITAEAQSTASLVPIRLFTAAEKCIALVQHRYFRDPHVPASEVDFYKDYVITKNYKLPLTAESFIKLVRMTESLLLAYHAFPFSDGVLARAKLTEKAIQFKNNYEAREAWPGDALERSRLNNQVICLKGMMSADDVHEYCTLKTLINQLPSAESPANPDPYPTAERILILLAQIAPEYTFKKKIEEKHVCYLKLGRARAAVESKTATASLVAHSYANASVSFFNGSTAPSSEGGAEQRSSPVGWAPPFSLTLTLN